MSHCIRYDVPCSREKCRKLTLLTRFEANARGRTMNWKSLTREGTADGVDDVGASGTNTGCSLLFFFFSPSFFLLFFFGLSFGGQLFRPVARVNKRGGIHQSVEIVQNVESKFARRARSLSPGYR